MDAVVNLSAMIVSSLRLLLALLALPWCTACLVMLLCFHSWRGLGCALWALAALAWLLALAWEHRLALRLGVALGLGLLILVGCSMRATDNSTVGVHLPGWNWMRWNPANLVPESDLAELGVRLLYPADRCQRILDTLRPLYAEMEARPEYCGLPHVIPYTAADVLGLTEGAGHFYYYLPPGKRDVPVLIFLHGAMGNFQSFLWHWQKWAEQRGWAVVCPTFGYGSWFHAGGAEAAEEALRQTLETLPVDPGRVALAGLSNGSTGAVRLLQRRPQAIRWLFLASPVIEVDRYTSPEVVTWAKTHAPPLVLEGDEDINVRPEVVKRRVADLERAGVHCQLRMLPGHDHHMMFTAQKEVYSALDSLVSSPSLVP